jgi:hypothetical protein
VWWLRSPGNNSNNAANVNTDGGVNNNGNNVSWVGGAVRPALPVTPETIPKLGGLRKQEKGSDPFSASDCWENTCWRKVRRAKRKCRFSPINGSLLGDCL